MVATPLSSLHPKHTWWQSISRYQKSDTFLFGDMRKHAWKSWTHAHSYMCAHVHPNALLWRAPDCQHWITSLRCGEWPFSGFYCSTTLLSSKLYEDRRETGYGPNVGTGHYNSWQIQPVKYLSSMTHQWEIVFWGFF